MAQDIEKPPPYVRHESEAAARSLLHNIPFPLSPLTQTRSTPTTYTLANPGPFHNPVQHSRFLPDTEDSHPPTDTYSDLRAALDFEFPPIYQAFEDQIRQVIYHHPYVIATSANGTTYPRYQVRAMNTKSGKPYRLQIRRLAKTESRRLSNTLINGEDPTDTRDFDFDPDLALYLVENTAGLNMLARSHNMEIRGRQRNTLPGTIHLDTSKKSKVNFWHVTPNLAGDALREENERKMQRFGYKPQNEINKELLFTASGRASCCESEWRDGDGKVVAKEMEGECLAIMEGVPGGVRDVLITGWLTKKWACGGLRTRVDEGLMLTLSRTLTNGSM